MYFSISAPQQVALPDGTVLSFRVNAQNSAICEIHIVGKDGSDEESPTGTHILSFNRNGGPSDTVFVPTPEAPSPAASASKPAVDTSAPTKPYPSVDKDAMARTPSGEPVRADDWQAKQSSDMYGSNKPKVDSKPAA